MPDGNLIVLTYEEAWDDLLDFARVRHVREDLEYWCQVQKVFDRDLEAEFGERANDLKSAYIPYGWMYALAVRVRNASGRGGPR